MKIDIEYLDNGTSVKNCYLYDNKTIFKISLTIFVNREIADLKNTRSIKSLYNEIVAHKRLYKIFIFRNRTRDADLEEPISKFMDFFYKIISL